jgi:predicted SprT family Zn-dependent metalloprotease
MKSLTADKTGALCWDFYVTERDEFLGSIRFEDFDLEKRTCHFHWTASEADGEFEEYLEAFQYATEFAIFERKMNKVHTTAYVSDTASQKIYQSIGYLVGRDFSLGKDRVRRFSCDRYDLVRAHAEAQMAEHLDMAVWSFGWDSAKKRLGVCKYDQHLISLSRYFVDYHSLEEIDQVMRHEIAHALAGSKAGHGPKWKKIATELGYNHKKISGDEIGNATAKLIGTCPNGHTVYRHRKPKAPLSCSRCSTRFDYQYLFTWTER